MRTPTFFDLGAHNKRWYKWADIEKCFWPGVGMRSVQVDEFLSKMVKEKGVYCIAWDPSVSLLNSGKAFQNA